MKRIGMVVAVELEAVLNKYGKEVHELNYNGFKVKKYLVNGNELFVAQSGAGEIAAAMTTQFLISELNVEVIINFGVVGGLSEEIKLYNLCVVESVVHYDFDTSEADNCEVGRYLNYESIYIPTDENLIEIATSVEQTLKRVVCASGDKFISNKDKKDELRRLYNADICEMEAAGIVLTANRNQTPVLLIKAVSDSLNGGVIEFKDAFNNAAEICMEITSKVMLMI